MTNYDIELLSLYCAFELQNLKCEMINDQRKYFWWCCTFQAEAVAIKISFLLHIFNRPAIICFLNNIEIKYVSVIFSNFVSTVHSWRQTTTRSGFDETEIKYIVSVIFKPLGSDQLHWQYNYRPQRERAPIEFQKKTPKLSLTIHDSWELESQQSKTPLINSQMLNHAYN